jgi:hypothetical protein
LWESELPDAETEKARSIAPATLSRVLTSLAFYPSPPFLYKLDNGKEVDNTYKRKQPFRFKVASGQVVKGWDEAVKQLSVGEKASCTFPASLAYGAKGFPGLIPPHSNLHVIVELVAIMISD